jgi:hypothetical protein
MTLKLKCDRSEEVKYEITQNIHSFKTFEFIQGTVKKEKGKKANKEKERKEILRLKETCHLIPYICNAEKRSCVTLKLSSFIKKYVVIQILFSVLLL